MKQVTNKFKDAIKTNGRQLDTIITIDNIPFTKEKFNSVIPKFNTNLFKSIMKGVEIDSNFYIRKNSKVNVKSGVLVNNNYEYIDYGNYSVYKEPEVNEDTQSWVTTVYDKILDSMIDYDLIVSYPISIRNYWVAIFNRLGWDISGIPDTFTNSSKMINQDVHSGIGYTFRDVLDELCTISAVFLVNKDGIPTIMTPKETNQVIDETYLKDTNVTVKEKVFFNSLVFARAEESDNIYRKDDTSIEENGLHEFRISDNQLLSTNDRVNYIDELWEYLKTFEYYSFDIDTVGVMFLEPIDKFTISANGNNYSTILLNDTTTISQGLTENMYSDSPEETETEYKYADNTDKKINQTYILVDKQNQKIEAVVSEVGQYDERITKVEQTTDQISQEVSQITVPIQEVNGNGSITLENTSNTDLYTFSIKGNISLLFGNDGKQYGEPVFFSDNLYFNDNQVFSTGVPLAEILYPSSTLFGKNMNLIIEYEDETQVIKLPFTYLNYISQDVCDEFKIEDGRASVIRRVGIKSNMQKYQLENEVIEDLGEFAITLKEGNPKIYLQCFDSAIYNASYMIKNEYTDIFATKVDLSSSITQLNNKITFEVIGKIDTLDKELNAKIELKVNTTDLISEINASADIIRLTGNRIIIDSELFKLSEDGKVEMLDASVNGVFRQYDNSTGYLAIELNENQIKLYDWKSNLGRMGDISSVYLDDNKSKGIALIGDQDYIAIAFRTSETTSENIMTFYKNSLSTPYVRNTASGTLFPNAGGIEVENGFIKNWNIQGVSGELYVADPGSGVKVTVYVNNGLITGWDV